MYIVKEWKVKVQTAQLEQEFQILCPDNETFEHNLEFSNKIIVSDRYREVDEAMNESLQQEEGDQSNVSEVQKTLSVLLGEQQN